MIQSHTIDLDEVQIHYADSTWARPSPGHPPRHHRRHMPVSCRCCRPWRSRPTSTPSTCAATTCRAARPARIKCADYGRDVAAFLQTVVGRPAVVAGHSLGGMIAVWLAAQASDWVQGLFLEDPPLYITQPPRLQETLSTASS